MAVFELTLRELMEDLDGGRVGAAFMQELRRVVADMEDRPTDDKERQVVLTAKFEPISDDSGHLDEVRGKFHVTSKVPNRRSKAYSFASRNGSKLVFNDLSEDDVHQKTIDNE